MKFKTACALIPLLFLASCATRFTPAQRASLATVMIAKTVVNADAYAEPYGGDRGAADTAALSGTSSGTGALGGVVGSLVGQAIAASQDQMFRGKSQGSFAAVQRNTPEVGGILQTKLAADLKNDPFLGPRLRNAAAATITSKVTSYQLVRNGKNGEGELLFTPKLVVHIHLNDAAGKKLAGGTYVGIGESLRVSEYAASAATTKAGYELAATTAAHAFTAALARKTVE